MTLLSSARPRSPALVGSAAGFLLSTIAADPLSSWLASSPAPPPDVPADVARRWFVDNAASSSVHAAIMLISVGFLAVFVLRFRAVPQRSEDRTGRVRTVLGLASAGVVAMSSVVTWTLGVQAIELPPTLVELTRTGQLVVGGSLHVALLGGFVLVASRSAGVPQPVRRFAALAAVLAIGSLVSMAVPHAAFLIEAGRLTGTGWCVVAAVAMAGGSVSRLPTSGPGRYASRPRLGAESRLLTGRDPLGKTTTDRGDVPLQERLLGQMTGQLDR